MSVNDIEFIKAAGRVLADRGPTVRVGRIDILSIDGRHVLWPYAAEEAHDPSIQVLDGSIDDAVEAAEEMAPRLTPLGQQLVRSWVESHTDSEAINAAAFFSDAESAAGDAGPGQDIVIEIESMLASDGRPHTLIVPPSMFRY